MKWGLLALLLVAATAQAQHSDGDKRAITFTSVPAITVASLPTCNAGSNGLIYKITDALTPIVAAVAVGGGAVSVLVHCQSGTGWVIG
jgi:anti-sigma-K factor RskA